MRQEVQLRSDVMCTQLAARQHGCISLVQAVALGMSEYAVFRLASRGIWTRIFPGVYVIAGSESSWRQRLMAAVLWLGEGATVSHGAAAAMWSMPGFPAGTLELSTTANRRSRYGITVHRVRNIGRHEVGVRGELPVTTPTRTLLDLSADADHEAFEVAFHHCLHRRTISLGRMRMICAQRRGPGAMGAPLLREMVELYADDERPPESPLEVRVRRLLAKEKLPPPTRQHPVTAAGRDYRIDLAYPAIRVAIEVDGYRWHSNRLSWDKDRTKIAALQGEGWQVVHVTYDLATSKTVLLLGAIRRALRASLPLDGR